MTLLISLTELLICFQDFATFATQKSVKKEDSSQVKISEHTEPAKPAYPRTHPKQRMLEQNVIRIQVETLICPHVLGHSSFDRAIKGADSSLQVF